MSAPRDGGQLPQRAWPIEWKQDPRIDDGHSHEWSIVAVAPHPVRFEPLGGYLLAEEEST